MSNFSYIWTNKVSEKGQGPNYSRFWYKRVSYIGSYELICAICAYVEVKNKIFSGWKFDRLRITLRVEASFMFLTLWNIRFMRNIYAMYSVSYRYNPYTTNPNSVYKQLNPNIHNFYSIYMKKNHLFPYKFAFGQIIRIRYTPSSDYYHPPTHRPWESRDPA